MFIKIGKYKTLMKFKKSFDYKNYKKSFNTKQLIRNYLVAI